MRMSSSTVFAFLAAALLLAPPVLAQGDLDHNNARFEYNSFAGIGGASVDFEVDTGTDHVFENWWWYRVDGDADETVFPAPDPGDTYTDNVDDAVAELEWADVDGRGLFSAEETVTLVGSGAGAGSVRHDLTITNLTSGDLTLSIYHFADFDVDASAGSDSSTVSDANRELNITETSSAFFRGLGADAYAVDGFPNISGLLGNGVIDNLANTGGVFGPGDFTGALQWLSVTLKSGVSTTFSVVKTVNEPVVARELAFLGSCPGAVEVQIEDMTSNGRVAIAGSSMLGSFTVPAGPCTGTVLNLDSPSVLAMLTADADGAITANLNLQQQFCGQYVQAVDLTTCEVTNVDVVP